MTSCFEVELQIKEASFLCGPGIDYASTPNITSTTLSASVSVLGLSASAPQAALPPNCQPPSK